MASSDSPDYAVLLAGDEVGLGHAELAALEAVDQGTDPEILMAGRVRITPSRRAASECAQATAWGEHWTRAPAHADSIAMLAQAARDRTTGEGSIRVRATRYGEDGDIPLQPFIAEIGAALVSAGHTVDLTNPDHEVYLWSGDGQLQLGLLRGVRGKAHGERIMEKRAHFSPIGMHPRRAASLVHLARVKPGGRILDPFCGTGGIVLEAAAEGYDAWGSDLDAWMVQGTLQALADAADEPLDATVFQADIAAVPGLTGTVDGIVTDMPYGKASSTDKEALADLYNRALAAFSGLLAPGGLAVVGHMDPQLLANAVDHDLEVATWGPQALADTHQEYVHATMTRHYTVLRRR